MIIGSVLSQVPCDGRIDEMMILLNNSASIVGDFEELPLEIVEECITELEEDLTIREDGRSTYIARDPVTRR